MLSFSAQCVLLFRSQLRFTEGKSAQIFLLDIQISLCSCVTQIVQPRVSGYSAIGIVFRDELPGLIDTLQLPTFCKSAGFKKIPDSQIDRVVL